MSTAGNTSYFSRFLLKFVEIIAAGLATAASGYLIAHLSGILSSPISPSGTAVIATPNVSTMPGMAGYPIPSISADINQQPIAPQQEPKAQRSTQPAPAPTAATMAKPEPPTRHIENMRKAAESTRDRESWATRVRAALSNAANRSDPLDTSQHRGVIQPAATAEPGVVSDSTNTRAVSAGAAAAPELRPAPLEDTTVKTNPPSVVEIPSHPIAAVQPSPAPSSGKETGTLSRLEQMLRNDPLAGTDEAPRPPLPVGQE